MNSVKSITIGEMKMYVVIDRKTKAIIGKPLKNLALASKKCERLDLEYGAYRYFYRRVEMAAQ